MPTRRLPTLKGMAALAAAPKVGDALGEVLGEAPSEPAVVTAGKRSPPDGSCEPRTGVMCTLAPPWSAQP